MREVITKIYKYNELPTEEAKAKARDWYREADTEYHWADDALASLEAFAKHFNAHLIAYSFAWDRSSHSYAKFNYREHEEEETLAHLIGQLKHDGSCQFTGYCADDDCNQGAVEAYKTGERNLGEILQAGFEAWLEAAQSDYLGSLEDDAVEETIVANEYEFEEDGNSQLEAS